MEVEVEVKGEVGSEGGPLMGGEEERGGGKGKKGKEERREREEKEKEGRRETGLDRHQPHPYTNSLQEQDTLRLGLYTKTQKETKANKVISRDAGRSLVLL